MSNTMTRTPQKSRSTKPTTKQLTAEQHRVLAEHAERKETQQRKQDRTLRVQRAMGVPQKRWAHEKNVTTAAKHAGTNKQGSAPATPDTPEKGRGTIRERKRRELVRTRNRTRRVPWVAAAATVAYGWLTQAMTWLFGIAEINPLVTAGLMTLAPLGVAGVTAGKTVPHAERRRWLPDLAIAGLSSAAIGFWIGTGGMSWLVLLTVLLATLALGVRWWRAHPLGPRVPKLDAPAPDPAPVPTPPAPRQQDEYAELFRHTSLGRLTNRTDGENTIHYDVEITGEANVRTLHNSIEKIATKLGIDPQQLIVEPAPKQSNGFRPHNRARLTIVTSDVTAGERYYTGPTVHLATDGSAGVLQNLARFRDGQGEAQITMWSRDGMVPTAIFGSTGGGKSAGANALACGALSTGLLNSIYVDFKGNSSGALRSRARIVVVGRDAVTDTKQLVKLLTDVRITNDPRDKQFPSTYRPGWFVLMDEITKGIKGDPKFAQEMEHMATTVRSLGVWLVATSQDMHSTAWHNTNTRAAFAKQAITFYMNTSSDQLVNGLTYRPSQLPTYDDVDAAPGQEGKPVPGFAVHANAYRANVPCRWDWLPADDDPVDVEPPYRASAAFDEFFNEPGIAQDEYDALVAALGKPNDDGRWIIGIGGTHTFGTTSESESGGQRPVRTTGFGAPANPDEDGLPDSQRRVYQLIEGGTSKTSDIEAACPSLGRSTVHDALGKLSAAGWITRAARGEYTLATPEQ